MTRGGERLHTSRDYASSTPLPPHGPPPFPAADAARPGKTRAERDYALIPLSARYMRSGGVGRAGRRHTTGVEATSQLGDERHLTSHLGFQWRDAGDPHTIEPQHVTCSAAERSYLDVGQQLVPRQRRLEAIE